MHPERACDMRGSHMNGLFVLKPRTLQRAAIPEKTGFQSAFDRMQALCSSRTSLAVLCGCRSCCVRCFGACFLTWLKVNEYCVSVGYQT
jgi:hypothetical protein